MPRALKEPLPRARLGLLGLLGPDGDAAFSAATAARETELSRRLEALREWYSIAKGPDCWRELCLAMAAERFPGFRENPGRKPKKWTMGTLIALAGEMRRVLDTQHCTQEAGAQALAGAEPWRRFLGAGRHHRRGDRAAWENLLEQYRRLSDRQRSIGDRMYVAYREGGAEKEWKSFVASFLVAPGSDQFGDAAGP